MSPADSGPPASSGRPAPAGARKGGTPQRVIGLVGGIASGKTTVARLFAERVRVAHVDADVVAREVLREPAVAAALRTRFPGAIGADGSMDRTALADRVFGRPEELAALERLTHPRIRSGIEARIAAASGPWVLLDAALLQETGADSLCDVVVFVACPARTRRRRAARTRGWTAEEHARRERRQWPVARKRARADLVVDNGDGEERTRESVRETIAAIEDRG